MKVIVATSESQGERTTDYHFAIEGELIEIQEPCGRDRRAGPGEVGCGCSRGFAGLSSHRATTTVRIAEIPGLTVADYVSALEASLEAGGWIHQKPPSSRKTFWHSSKAGRSAPFWSVRSSSSASAGWPSPFRERSLLAPSRSCRSRQLGDGWRHSSLASIGREGAQIDLRSVDECRFTTPHTLRRKGRLA